MKSVFGKVVSVILMLAMVLTLGACDNGEKPKEAVINLIEALKTMDMEKVEKYISTGSLTSVTVENLADGDMVIEAAFSNLSVEITDVKVDGDTAVVNAKISTIDLEAIMGHCTTLVMQEFMSGTITEEQMDARVEKVFKETLAKPGNPTITNDVEIDTIKVDGDWKIVSDDDFQNAISGGFLGAVANAQSQMFATE